MKRIAAYFLACMMVLTLTCGAAGATFTTEAEVTAPDAGVAELLGEMGPMASYYISKYEIYLYPGYSSGELELFFYVSATRTMDTLGISQVKIYKENGTLVTTIYGSASNGLLGTGSVTIHNGSYSYYGATSGAKYYAVVVAYAADSAGSDARIYTTNTQTAP